MISNVKSRLAMALLRSGLTGSPADAGIPAARTLSLKLLLPPVKETQMVNKSKSRDRYPVNKTTNAAPQSISLR